MMPQLTLFLDLSWLGEPRIYPSRNHWKDTWWHFWWFYVFVFMTEGMVDVLVMVVVEDSPEFHHLHEW